MTVAVGVSAREWEQNIRLAQRFSVVHHFAHCSLSLQPCVAFALFLRCQLSQAACRTLDKAVVTATSPDGQTHSLLSLPALLSVPLLTAHSLHLSQPSHIRFALTCSGSTRSKLPAAGGGKGAEMIMLVLLYVN